MYSMHRPSHPNVACYNIPGNGTSAGRASPPAEQFSNLSRRRMSGERGCGASFPRGRAFCRFLFICFFRGVANPLSLSHVFRKKRKRKKVEPVIHPNMKSSAYSLQQARPQTRIADKWHPRRRHAAELSAVCLFGGHGGPLKPTFMGTDGTEDATWKL